MATDASDRQYAQGPTPGCASQALFMTLDYAAPVRVPASQGRVSMAPAVRSTHGRRRRAAGVASSFAAIALLVAACGSGPAPANSFILQPPPTTGAGSSPGT